MSCNLHELEFKQQEALIYKEHCFCVINSSHQIRVEHWNQDINKGAVNICNISCLVMYSNASLTITHKVLVNNSFKCGDKAQAIAGAAWSPCLSLAGRCFRSVCVTGLVTNY